ncbi:uncharacterized protein Z518_08292 [Rhinocladiella mackenziei CBS 650.93]|uniref:NmrA-like domain-containing protein n=1 Tax=Rhinocladiella mackenziei CBS 650.93 TaxID=1442369 RepID=A0A0D2IGE2_9EURO|nr:uncharacterized protein Z518_08292 [Rhinocladiella mackenziei CBS 650.93]KIX02351.1 hypothetical protein Z518_08292 [Rhinocladiella mackenziei CBS 650.93]
MSTKAIKKVAVVGGSGATGPPVVQALLQAQFEVSVLSRESSTATFPEGVKVIKTNYSHNSLVAALKGQEAVVSTISTFSLAPQIAIIDAAIEAGVRRFLPSEFGVDTSSRALGEGGLPPALTKTETVAYLKSKESTGMTWTAVIVGAFFDWSFAKPITLGWNLPENTATIFDGGDIEFEATNLAQIGRAVAAILSAQHMDKTANQYVYINSFTTTQNEMLKIFEKLGGKKYQVKHVKADDFNKSALEKMQSDPDQGKVWTQGVLEAIVLIMMNYRGFCQYSKTKGLWNKRLGLPEENPEDTIREVLATAAGQN